MQTSKWPSITWTLAKRNALHDAYSAAREGRLDQFTFEGHEFLVSYARYLLEYLDGEFASEPKQLGP